MTTFIYFLGFIACLLVGGYTVTRKWDYTPYTALMQKTMDVKDLTAQYNAAIRDLENKYKHDKIGTKRQYSRSYQSLASQYHSERRRIIATWENMNPAWCKAKKAWAVVFFIGLIAAFLCCSFSLPQEESHVSSAVSTNSERYWNAETIPMPHLQDANQYVSNPDNILSQNTVDQMNMTLKRLDTELGIESVVIIVNHIENDDPFRFAQDVGNKYGVGRNDRGLMVVVGYLDHSINMSPGRSLEGDLTDVECRRLQQEYVVPAMRAEMPDSGMLYLTEAVYATMQKKSLPEMAELSSKSDDIDDEIATTIGMYFLFFIAWAIFFLRLNNKYQWLAVLSMATIRSNPFYEEYYSSGSSSYRGGRGGSSWGGGGFSGGSFGGGSFGGGGATSRW
mgnify:FL=1